MKKYFSVKTKCGHVGRFNCIWIEFAIVAESKQQAADKVREEGRVKRDHKDFIKEIKEISFEEFIKTSKQYSEKEEKVFSLLATGLGVNIISDTALFLATKNKDL